MANVFSPFGLLPYEGADGASPTYGTRWQYVLYSNSTKIFRGDPALIGSDGYIAQWSAGTAVSQLAGIFWGCEYYSLSQGQVTFSKYWPGADVATNAVIKCQLIPINTAVPPMFYVQTSDSNTTAVPVTQADVGQNYDVALGTGSTLSGMSGAYLDIHTANTTSTLPFRLVQLYTGPGPASDATLKNNWVVVQANIYQETGI
jgi:hypothetical protein